MPKPIYAPVGCHSVCPPGRCCCALRTICHVTCCCFSIQRFYFSFHFCVRSCRCGTRLLIKRPAAHVPHASRPPNCRLQLRVAPPESAGDRIALMDHCPSPLPKSHRPFCSTGIQWGILVPPSAAIFISFFSTFLFLHLPSLISVHI